MSTTTPSPVAIPTGGGALGGVTDSTFGIPISERAAHLAQVYIGVTSALLCLCIIAFGTRIYQRVHPVWKAGADDYFIVAGFILTVADWALLFGIMVPQPGLVPSTRSTLAAKNSWLAISVWGLAMTCIKTSVALTLLRIQGGSPRWRAFLYTVIALQAVYGVGNTLFNLAIACRPLRAAWDPFSVPQGEGGCVSIGAMRAVSNLGSSLNITTDVLLSLAPATFLRRLNRPLRERVLVCALMGMGLLASVSSIVKTVLVRDWAGGPGADGGGDDDWWATGVAICTWTALEQLLGVLAACVPAMKGVLQRCLGAMGVSLTDPGSRQRSGYGAGYYGSRHGGGSVGVVSRAGRGEAPTAAFRSQLADFRGDSRFPRKAKEVLGHEICVELPDISRTNSAKSLEDRSLGHGHDDSRDHSVEQLPAHAV